MRILEVNMRSKRLGVLLITVLVALLVAMGAWAAGYRRLMAMVKVAERTEWGYTGSVNPDVATALARVIDCLRLQTPPASPYKCRMTVGMGTAQQGFTIDTTDQGGGLFRVSITPGADASAPVCPTCALGGP